MEPFGIAAVEALAAGCPVIAYTEGGSRDIVQPGKNGVLFDEQTVDSLVAAIKDFETQKFKRSVIKQTAQVFKAQNFQKGIKKLVATALSEQPKPAKLQNPEADETSNSEPSA